ncbi:hypothetical protein [Flavobacterium sp. GP15]|uniref:hypothetical protein n=1 Tax=Flavobacterium sp. GP15 TaxID=2758567 RepID=UPI00165E3D8A|nr:hypothetical protein [Flavobacterium sp. GP15]
MKKIIFLFIITFYTALSSQNIEIIGSKTNTLVFDGDEFLGYDNLGFYYFIKNNVFHKRNNQNNLEYKNISLGKITKIDIQNPFKIIVFYENFNTIILLDNQLNEIQSINFSEDNTPIIATAVGLASQNQFWIYNTMNQQIGLYDYLKKEYRAIAVPFIDTIKYYQSDFNSFSWIDQKNNWYSCDIFGKIVLRGILPNSDYTLIINKNQIMYAKSGIITLEDAEKQKKYEIKIPEKTFNKFYYKDQILSIFTSEGITNYKIIIP